MPIEPDLPDNASTRFRQETARFREVLAKGRSANQVALFDLLVERSMDERSPKEVEIALALFGNDASLDANSDSGVRVYVHRLRKRIDDYYADKTGLRLVIPKGEYRIVLSEHREPEQIPTLARRIVGRIMANAALSAGLLLIALGGLAFAARQVWSPDPSGTARVGKDQSLFATLDGATNPLIVVGGSLLLAETEDQRSIQRLILNPAVQTREAFTGYLRDHPETFYQLYDFNLNFVPIEAVESAWQLRDKLNAGPGARDAGPAIIPVSALSLEQLQTRDVIYIGRLSQLGVLRQYVFAGSRMKLASYNRLVEAASGKSFEGQVYSSGQSPRQPDYGYLAVRTGASGRRLIVFAGLGDRGVAAMTGLLKAPDVLNQLKRQLGSARQFEAVFAVQSPEGRPLERRLVSLHALP